MVKIILADIHQAVRTLVKEFLISDPNFQVIGEAASGEESLKLVEALKPDILIMDLFVDGVKGLEITRQIHEQFPQVNIIVWSIYSIDGCVLRALEAGAKGYLIKDSGLQELVTAVREVSLGNLYLSPPLSKQRLEKYQCRNTHRMKTDS